MKAKIIKIILYLIIIAGVVALIKKFPDQTILVLGIVVVLIIGKWLLDADKKEYE
jgi:hypothetical protein